MSARRGVMVGGRGVKLDDDSAVSEAELFLCVEVDAGTTEAIARMASAVERGWLDPKLLEVRDDVTFDSRASRVVALRRTCWDDLVLDEVALGHIPDEKLAAALAQAELAVVCVDLDRPRTTLNEAFDGRASAIALASRRMFDGLGVWPLLAEDAGPIDDILLSLNHGAGLQAAVAAGSGRG